MEEKNVKKILGKRIQKLRKERGYTQREFSEMIGLSENYISDIECGKSYVKIDKLIRIINALQCTADDVFIDLIDCGYKVKSSQLSEILKTLSKQDQEKALKLLDVFINEQD